MEVRSREVRSMGFKSTAFSVISDEDEPGRIKVSTELLDGMEVGLNSEGEDVRRKTGCVVGCVKVTMGRGEAAESRSASRSARS